MPPRVAAFVAALPRAPPAPRRSRPAACARRPRAPAARALAAAALAAALALPALAAGAAPAAAGAGSRGADVFEASCAACHAGGGNVIGFARKKTLKAAALARYGYGDRESIVRLLREGKGVMPPYGRERMTDEDAGAVAEFVLSAAERGWK